MSCTAANEHAEELGSSSGWFRFPAFSSIFFPVSARLGILRVSIRLYCFCWFRGTYYRSPATHVARLDFGLCFLHFAIFFADSFCFGSPILWSSPLVQSWLDSSSLLLPPIVCMLILLCLVASVPLPPSLGRLRLASGFPPDFLESRGDEATVGKLAGTALVALIFVFVFLGVKALGGIYTSRQIACGGSEEGFHSTCCILRGAARPQRRVDPWSAVVTRIARSSLGCAG